MDHGTELIAAKAYDLSSLVDYAEGGIVSRTLSKGAAGTLTVFSFDAGQGLSEHSAPFDAMVLVLEGRVQLTIGGEKVEAGPGQLVRMPAQVPHAVAALERFKMALVMLRHSS